MELEIEVDGVKTRISDVSRYRQNCAEIKTKLMRLFVNFDPSKPEQMIDHEAQLVDYFNSYNKAAEIIARWDAAEGSRKNVVEVWKLYREIIDGKAGL